jgi:two-component system response regulator AtoC
MRQLMKFAARVAASEASTILLEGESGTGKDVIAKYLHHNSRRAAEPFIAINCAAIPETLLESELFGYEKGAFTDARAQKKGTLELAHGGTVFLDEIGEMPLLLQAKMLRVLEDQSFRRLGGTKDIQVDLRVIAATNRSVTDAVAEGKFRVDLYYRLNVIQIVVPPLRERRDDILPLAHHFVRLLNQRFGRDLQGLSPEAERALLAHDWPGNVRELRNAIERAMLLEETSWLRPASLALGGGTVVPAEEPEAVPGASTLDGMSLEEAERTLVVRALEKTAGNQTQAARLLNVTRDTLRYKMKKFNLGSPGTAPD